MCSQNPCIGTGGEYCSSMTRGKYCSNAANTFKVAEQEDLDFGCFRCLLPRNILSHSNRGPSMRRWRLSAHRLHTGAMQLLHTGYSSIPINGLLLVKGLGLAGCDVQGLGCEALRMGVGEEAVRRPLQGQWLLRPMPHAKLKKWLDGLDQQHPPVFVQSAQYSPFGSGTVE